MGKYLREVHTRSDHLEHELLSNTSPSSIYFLIMLSAIFSITCCCAAINSTSCVLLCTNEVRVQNRDILLPQIEAVLQTDTVAAWERLLGTAGVAVGPVNRMDQVFHDPQVVHS